MSEQTHSHPSKQIYSHPFNTEAELQAAIHKVNGAIDALLALEGSKVFPHGLPDCFSRTLSRLRTEAGDLNDIAEHWN